MPIRTHILGFPRLGRDRLMKRTVEAYWEGRLNRTQLIETGNRIQKAHWQLQIDYELDFITVGDFAWYDHILNVSMLLGIIPSRFKTDSDHLLDTMFRIARGRAPSGSDAPASAMRKWFDTNYHYIVPELDADQQFRIYDESLFASVDLATTLKHPIKVVLPSPLTYLFLSKTTTEFDRLLLLSKLLAVYEQILSRLLAHNVSWVQIDEPILSLDLTPEWRTALTTTYDRLSKCNVPILLTNYFGALDDNRETVVSLPVAGLHIDTVRGADEVLQVARALPEDRVLSLGVIDGRNIWRCDPDAATKIIDEARGVHANIWISSSCSLLHVPLDVADETRLSEARKSWLAFAVQKLAEIRILQWYQHDRRDSADLVALRKVQEQRRRSAEIQNPQVQARVTAVEASWYQRQSAFAQRYAQQQQRFNLPLLPTTTIGSFPQTQEIRQTRAAFRTGKLNTDAYQAAMRNEIAKTVKIQQELDLDVLVHGEPERNDMVEYFGEMLNGFLFTEQGWVQSYGSRCVKPPVIFGDVSRPQAMTVEWSQYAQSLTKKPMKGMLTGPVTMLCWSFVRDDIPLREVAQQIALALRDEVADLEASGIGIIQIDEPALREGLPLRKSDWSTYLEWAVNAFRLSAGGARDDTQIHTHMCYCDFNDIIESIAALDADVISIETSRSNMELLQVFPRFAYPNAIGPGVYDIHSPLVPAQQWIVDLLQAAAKYIAIDRLWVNPDCGLKTRNWEEVKAALANMVAAAKTLRNSQK